MSEHTILLGACGWQHAQWRDSYYPEDLPEDWQLAYYGNEYPVVLIPAAYWVQGRQAVAAWLEETADSPRFVCEWNWDPQQQTEILAMVDALGDRVVGVLCPVQGKADSGQVKTIKELAARFPVCLDWPDTAAQQPAEFIHSELAGTTVSVCWHGDARRESDLQHGALVIARITCAQQTPRRLRAILESILAGVGARQAVLLFDGDPPDLQVMQQAGVILNLL